MSLSDELAQIPADLEHALKLCRQRAMDLSYVTSNANNPVATQELLALSAWISALTSLLPFIGEAPEET